MTEPIDTQYWAEKIGTNIRENRKNLGLSLEDLSLLSSCTVPTLSYIERGKRNLKLSTLVSLATALRIKPSELFQEDGGQRSSPKPDLDILS